MKTHVQTPTKEGVQKPLAKDPRFSHRLSEAYHPITKKQDYAYPWSPDYLNYDNQMLNISSNFSNNFFQFGFSMGFQSTFEIGDKILRVQKVEPDSIRRVVLWHVTEALVGIELFDQGGLCLLKTLFDFSSKKFG